MRKDIFDNKKLGAMFKRMAGGDRRALRVFYDAYAVSIYTIARSVTRRHEDAEEVLDDVLVKVWNNAPSAAGQANPGGWLYIVTINAARDRVRRAEPVLPQERDIPDERDDYAAVNDMCDFSALIAGLTELEQKILICRFVHDMTFADISRALSVPQSTIASAYYAALKKLKKKLSGKS